MPGLRGTKKRLGSSGHCTATLLLGRGMRESGTQPIESLKR